jgi:predicted ATPase
MLKNIRLTNFKRFVDEEIQLAPLTLLVGSNASGKSNLLDAIRFLQGISSGLTIAEILNGEESSRPDAWPGIRGRAQEAARIGTSQFSIRSYWLAPHLAVDPDLKQKYEVSHSILCRAVPSPSIVEETFSGLDGGGVGCGRSTSDGLIELFPDSAGPGIPTNLSAKASLLGQKADTQFVLKVPALFLLSDALWHHLSMIRFLELKPNQMRGYGRRGEPLGSDGKNLSGVLADLCEEPAAKQSLIEWLSELLAPELQDIEFGGDPNLGDIMAILVERDGRKISARSISDGTLQFLGILLALRTAEAGSTFLIEEIGDGLHPARVQLLVRYLEAVTRARSIQVIATTHSPVVLDWLSDEALRNVVVFGRVPEHEGTLMRRLGDLPHFDETVARTGIEELFTTGWLEMAL